MKRFGESLDISSGEGGPKPVLLGSGIMGGCYPFRQELSRGLAVSMGSWTLFFEVPAQSKVILIPQNSALPNSDNG